MYVCFCKYIYIRNYIYTLYFHTVYIYIYTYTYDVYIYIYPVYHYNPLAPVAPFFGFPLWPSRRHRLVAFLVDGEFGGFKWTFLMGRYVPLYIVDMYL